MKGKETMKNISILVVAIALIVGAYFLFVKKDAPSDTVSASASSAKGAGSSIVSIREIERIGRQLEKVEIDTAFFSDPVFESLVDFRTVIPEEPVGKQNPFAPSGALDTSSGE